MGIRGSGKSAWWAALQSPSHRRLVTDTSARGLEEVETVDAGFGEVNRPDDYPDPRTIAGILAAGADASDIWRTVVAWQTWGKSGPLRASETWLERTRWMAAHPDESARAFARYDDQLAERKVQHLILFDALDRAADSWSALTRLLQGVLKLLLEFRSYRSIRAKAFVRPDMLEDPLVTGFPDASKVLATRAELQWSRVDLFGLLFQHLANAPEGGEAFREGCSDEGSGRWSISDGVWQVPGRLREDQVVQRKVFHAIAGPWMGRDRRRGFPYTWLPSHLADAMDQVSPRSFLAAVRTSADVPVPTHGGWPHALHFEGIKQGVQAASRIRVEEVSEDFFWVPLAMEPLAGLVIPCDFEEIDRRWSKAGVLDELPRRAALEGRLPP